MPTISANLYRQIKQKEEKVLRWYELEAILTGKDVIYKVFKRKYTTLYQFNVDIAHFVQVVGSRDSSKRAVVFHSVPHISAVKTIQIEAIDVLNIINKSLLHAR